MRMSSGTGPRRATPSSSVLTQISRRSAPVQERIARLTEEPESADVHPELQAKAGSLVPSEHSRQRRRSALEQPRSRQTARAEAIPRTRETTETNPARQGHRPPCILAPSHPETRPLEWRAVY